MHIIRLIKRCFIHSINRCYLLGILAIFLMSCEKKQSIKEPLTATIKAIQYVIVEPQTVLTQRQFSGYLRPTKSARLSFEVTGQLTKLNVKSGDAVVTGQVLASIDNTAFTYKVAQAKAELASANAGFKERSENYQRQSQLFNQQLINKNAIDKAKAEYEQAQSLVALAQAKLSLSTRDLQQTTLIAPFAGVITHRAIEQFEKINHGDVVLEIQDKTNLEVSFLLPSSMISSIELSDNISLTIPIINDLPQGAKITKIGIKSNMRGAYPVSAELDNTQSTIHAGMAADVFIQSKLKTLGIILPESAVFIAANGDEQVFIFNPKNNQVSPRTITSQLINIDQLLITSGLKANDIVCTAGAEFLSDGQQVTLYQATH